MISELEQRGLIELISCNKGCDAALYRFMIPHMRATLYQMQSYESMKAGIHSRFAIYLLNNANKLDYSLGYSTEKEIVTLTRNYMCAEQVTAEEQCSFDAKQKIALKKV